MRNKKQGSVLSKLLVSQSGEQDRRTPINIFKVLDKEFNFELDPCTSLSKKNNLKTPYFFTKKQDGLKQDWGKFKPVFINPPFKDMSKWVDKILLEISRNNNQIIVLLVPAKTETRWFHRLINSNHLKELRFQERRVTFEGHENPFIIGICYFILKKDSHKCTKTQGDKECQE